MPSRSARSAVQWWIATVRRSAILLFLSLSLLCSCGRSPQKATRGTPQLIRLSDLANDRNTKFTNLRYTVDNFELLQGDGWSAQNGSISAMERKPAVELMGPMPLKASIHLRFRARAPGAKKRKLKVTAHGEELTRFQLQEAWRDYEMTVPPDQMKTGPLRLRFVFTGKRYGKSPWAEFEFLELLNHFWVECQLKDELRPAFVVPAKSTMSFRLTLPSGSPKLTVGLGALYKRKAPLDVTFQIDVKKMFRTNTVYRKTLSFSRNDQGWVDEQIDLTGYAGENVTIDFENSARVQHGLIAWSSPEIYDSSAKRETPNIILISVDTLRKDRVSYYGMHSPLTPNLDALANKSYVYGNAFCTGPGTLMSHTSIFTGWYVAKHKLRKGAQVLPRRSYIDPEWVSIPELAASARYRTAAFTDGGYLSHFYGFQQGFQSYTQNTTLDKFNTVTTLDHGAAWLEKNSDRPFFLFLHTYRVHEPFKSSYVVFHRLFPSFPLSDERDLRISGADLGKLLNGEVPLTERRKQFVNSMYDAGVSSFDERFGIFCKRLEQLGLMKNTVIVLFGDHGEQLFDRDRGFGHGKSLRPEEIRVPLIVYAPGRGHRDDDRLASLVDIYPTLAELMRIRPPNPVDGSSLLHSGDRTTPARTIFYEVSFGHDQMFWGAQNSEYKLLVNTNSGKEFFYNIRKDPAENHDLSSSGLPVMKELRNLLGSYIQKSMSSAGIRASDNQEEENEELKERLRALGYIN